MAKVSPIKKMVNGEIADAEDVNQAIESGGSQGGLIPFDPDTDEYDDTGSQSLGSTLYPWGSFNVNQDAWFYEIDTASPSVSAAIQFKNLRRFTSLKDAPSSYAGKGTNYVTVNEAESALEFVTSPIKSNEIFRYGGAIRGTAGSGGWGYWIGSVSGSLPTDTSESYWSDNASYHEVIRGKVQKISGVSTVTVWLYAESVSGGGANDDGTVKIDIGGQTVEILMNADNTWFNADIDVSALSNNAIYDLKISIKNGASTNAVGFNTIIGIGS